MRYINAIISLVPVLEITGIAIELQYKHRGFVLNILWTKLAIPSMLDIILTILFVAWN